MQLEQHRLWTYDFDAWLETESSVKSSNSSSIVLSCKIFISSDTEKQLSNNSALSDVIANKS